MHGVHGGLSPEARVLLRFGVPALSLSACGESPDGRKSVPQGLKPLVIPALVGTTEVVPFQNLTVTTGCYGLAKPGAPGEAALPED